MHLFYAKRGNEKAGEEINEKNGNKTDEAKADKKDQEGGYEAAQVFQDGEEGFHRCFIVA